MGEYRLRDCVHKERADNPAISGSVTLTLGIGVDAKAAVVSSTPTGNLGTNLASCLQAEAAALTFAPRDAASGIKVRVTVEQKSP